MAKKKPVKGKKRKPIYVTDPNDPRLQMYSDSSLLFNLSNDQMLKGTNNKENILLNKSGSDVLTSREREWYKKTKNQLKNKSYPNSYVTIKVQGDKDSDKPNSLDNDYNNDEYFHPDIKPIGGYNWSSSTGIKRLLDSNDNFLYKEPVQPIVYKPMVDHGNIIPSATPALKRKISKIPPKRRPQEVPEDLPMRTYTPEQVNPELKRVGAKDVYGQDTFRRPRQAQEGGRGAIEDYFDKKTGKKRGSWNTTEDKMVTGKFANGGDMNDIEYANGGGVNRFMKTAEYFEPTQGFKLDYNQLAAGVLAREDAYDTNAAEIDKLDTSYFKGISGAEDDEARRLNGQMEEIVSTLGDEYDGDLSKAGDAIRNAKKWQRSVTKEGSEGALINANYKAYQANVKELQELKGWSRDKAEAWVSKAQSDHNNTTNSSKEENGKFATYQRAMPNEWQDLHKQSLELAKSMPVDKLTQMMGVDYGAGEKLPSGEYRFFNTTKGSWETRSSEEIASKLMPVIMKDPKNAAYLDSAAGLTQWQMNQSNSNRFTEKNLEIQSNRDEFSRLRENALKGGIEEKKELQKFLGLKGKDVDGVIGVNTNKLITKTEGQLKDDYTKEIEYEGLRKQIASNAVNPAADFFEINNEAITTTSKNNPEYTAELSSAKEKVREVNTVSGFSSSETNKELTYKELQEKKEAVKFIYDDAVNNFYTQTGMEKAENNGELLNTANNIINMSDSDVIKKYGSLLNPEFLQKVDASKKLVTATINKRIAYRNNNNKTMGVEVADKVTNSFNTSIRLSAGLGKSEYQTFNTKNYNKHKPEIEKVLQNVAKNNGTAQDFIKELMKNETIAKDLNLDELPAEYGEGFMRGTLEKFIDVVSTDNRVNVLTKAYDSAVNKNRTVIEAGDNGSREATTAFIPSNVWSSKEDGNTRATRLKTASNNFIVANAANEVGPIVKFQVDDDGKPIKESNRSYNILSGTTEINIIDENGNTNTYLSEHLTPLLKEDLEDAYESGTNTPEEKENNKRQYFESENISYSREEMEIFIDKIKVDNPTFNKTHEYTFSTKKGNFILRPIPESTSKQFIVYELRPDGSESYAYPVIDPDTKEVSPIPEKDAKQVEATLGEGFLIRNLNTKQR